MIVRTTTGLEGETLTINVPLTFRKQGGRKRVVTPDGAPWAPRPRVDTALVKALARAFRWQRLLDASSTGGTIGDLARRERVTPSYMSRLLHLTLLAPEIVEAILEGRQPEDITLESLLKGFPLEWAMQGQAKRQTGARAQLINW